MSDLYWEISWPHGVHPLDSETKNACQRAIQEYLLRSAKVFGSADIGYSVEGLPVRTQHIREEISARLVRLMPPDGVRVDRLTNIYAVNPSGTNGSGSGPNGPASDDELDSFILWKTTFDASRPDPYFTEIYDSLLGTEKEVILEEAMSLLAPVDTLQKWSLRHYNRAVPILRTVTSKVPLIIFGGDPGTGKTALATSMGAPLSQRLGENVHFQHMSLAMRGMGYQGRASTLIAKSFTRINEGYMKLSEPMIIFFDEAEALVGSRDETGGDSGAQENVAIVNAIINGVDGLRKGIHARVVVVFATNIIGRIDAALMRRCYYHSFERPNEEVRRALLKSSLQGLGFDDTALDILVQETRPRMVNRREIAFTHSDIVELIIVRAVNAAIRANKAVTLDLLIDCCKKAIPTRSLTK